MFWTLPRKGRRTKTQTVMNKKIYNTPLVEQAECIMFGALCQSPTGDPNPGDNSGSGQQPPTGNAPARPF